MYLFVIKWRREYMYLYKCKNVIFIGGILSMYFIYYKLVFIMLGKE